MVSILDYSNHELLYASGVGTDIEVIKEAIRRDVLGNRRILVVVDGKKKVFDVVDKQYTEVK